MAHASFLKQHRAWEDWVGIGLGFLVLLSPWLAAGQPDDNEVANANAAAIGLIILVVAGLELFGASRWEDATLLASGLWLIAAPVVLDYGNAVQLGYWHVGLGALVALLAAFELWQDWRASDVDLAGRR